MTDRSPLVDAKCGRCGHECRMLPIDVVDHPCPRCGRYTGLRRVDSTRGETASTASEASNV